MIAEQKIRTQRVLGGLIKAGQDAGEIRKAGERDSNIPEGNISKLSDIGINPKQSMVFQQIARMPEDKFEAFIAECRTKIDELMILLSCESQKKGQKQRFTFLTSIVGR